MTSLTALKEMCWGSLEEDAAYLGGVALAKFQWEYWIQQNNHDDGKLGLYPPHCSATHLIYDLPCAHLIEQGFNQNTGQHRTLFNLVDFLLCQSQRQKQRTNYDYGNNVSKVEFVFGIANRNKTGQQIVDGFELITEKFKTGDYSQSTDCQADVFSPEIVELLEQEKRNESIPNSSEAKYDESNSHQNNFEFPLPISSKE